MKSLACLSLIASFGCVAQQPPPAGPAPAPASAPGETAPPPGDPSSAAVPSNVGPAGELHEYSGPLACSGMEDIFIDSADLDLGSDSIRVTGTCNVDISNSRIRASGAALIVAGSGDIRVRGSEIVGNPAGSATGSGDIELTNSIVRGDLVVAGSGDIVLVGNVIEGRTSVSGSGDVEDRGGNQFR